MCESTVDRRAIENFQKYIQIRSVHPEPDYYGCIEFLKQQSSDLNLPIQIFEFSKGKPIAIITWQGLEPNLSTILLNSHMDVVPADEEKWKYDPFAGNIDKEGRIYGRGTQDMKSVGIQYLEAIRRLQARSVRLRRTVHISFVPDEEIGSEDGMKAFTASTCFSKFNIGFMLDESGPSMFDEYVILCGERAAWAVEVTCTGMTGHGSIMLPDSASEKFQYIYEKLMDCREKNKKKMTNLLRDSGNVTSINLTILQGGTQHNVIPPKITATFDIRVHPNDLEDMESSIDEWCKAAGPGVTYKYLIKSPYIEPTKLDETNPFWIAFKSVFDQRKASLYHTLSPGATDARFLRAKGIPSIGFSPLAKTEFLLHSDNEFITVETFLKGIDIYEELIPAVANLKE